MSPHETTHVVELTPAGRAAVAVVLVAGPRAVAAVDACVVRPDGRRFGALSVDRIHLGRWGNAGGEELVVCRRAQDVVEIHCHGGAAAVRTVVERLVARGCEATPWQDWIRASAADPIRAAAHVALADAPTARTAAVLLDQFHGALGTAVQRALDAAAAADWPMAIATLESALANRSVGLHLTRPWRVVLAGRPNVGKSSLLNALVGFQRAIVCDLPGTTRDVVTASTAIDGWPIQLADTAGLHDARDEIESAGVALASAAAANADLVLLVDDMLSGEPADIKSSAPVLRVLNKIDLADAQRAATASRSYDVSTSALTGAGIPTLVAAIGTRLVPAPPAPGAAVPFTLEQLAHVDVALTAARRHDVATTTLSLRRLIA